MNKRKWLSILLCIVLALSMLPVATSAAEDTGDFYLTAVTGDPNGFNNEGYANLFDGNTESKWCFNFSSSAYVIFKASEPVKLSKYSIATANDTAGNPGRNPVEWTLSGCMDYEDASTSWAVIDTVTNGGLPSENETYTDFILSESTPLYQYFKLEITKINSGSMMQISEIALKDYTVCNHSYENGICTKCGFCGALQANYLDENGIELTAFCKTTINADNIGGYTNITAGWYLVKGTITADSRTNIYGDVHFILEDGCDFTINGGIEVNEPSSITIYCQQAGTGKLTCKGAESKNGIGGSTARGNITINGGIIYAQGGSNDGGAGIGGEPGGAITINGGTVTAIGTYNNSGIGGNRFGSTKSGGVITINGGRITAQGHQRSAGIGGAYRGDGGTITITGGIVEASGTGNSYGAGAGIGAGSGSTLSGTNGGSGGTIVITGGTVKATGTNGAAGIGKPSVGGSSGTFSTEKDGVKGNAVIFANDISDQSDKDNWNGVIFIGSTGKVYGTTVTPTDDFEMGSSNTLLISEGSTLKLDGINAVNNGDVYVDGTLNGNFSGTGSIYYPLAVTGGKAGGDISIYLYLDKVYGKAGGTVTLTASDDPMGMKMDGWTADPAVTVINNSFTMPASALTVTARYINAPTFTVTIPSSVELGGTATVTAEGVSVADGSQLVVKLSGTSGVNNAFTLSNGGSDTLTYRVTKGSKAGTAISVNGSVLTVAGGIADNSGSEALYFTPATEPKYAGKYTGTVTFTVSVEAVSST
ncbi:MAG: hypothetical protein ACI4I3_02060 [Acutalibacteraceae bacterium]